MHSLQSIDQLPKDAIDLLEAIGYLDAREFSTADRLELLDEMVKANAVLGIMGKVPDEDQVRQWQESVDVQLGPAPGEVKRDPHLGPLDHTPRSTEDLRERASRESDASDQHVSLTASGQHENFESDPEVQSMLDVSPTAELIPAELIKRTKLAVGDIPEGVLLTECQGDVAMKVVSARSKKQRVSTQKATAPKRTESLMTSRIRSFREHETEDHHIKPLDKGEQRDIVTLSKGLNAGLTPDSRRFVRGVLHPEPMRVRTSAFFAVLVQLMLVLTVFGIPALILIDQMYDYPATTWWVIGLLSCSLLSAIGYLIWGLAARCRVCGQRQFAPKKCLKNRKAHHIPLIGYIFPTSLHAIFFKWFYCTYCGTAVRLKK